MKFPIRLWRFRILTALAVCIGVSLAVALWFHMTGPVLTMENIVKASEFKTQAKFEQLFGPPNSTPDASTPQITAGDRPAKILVWEGGVSEQGRTFIRRFTVFFDPNSGEVVGTNTRAIEDPTLGGLWEEVKFWARKWWP